MKLDLSGKTAIVTGSTAGIGLAIAKGLAACGATVIVNGRKPAAVEAAEAAVEAAVPGAKVRGVVADLGTAEGCAALLAAEPTCDVLVNNVGIYAPGDFFEISDGEWEHFFQVNVMSGVRTARAYMKGMMARDWGRVVFISSESALNIPADMLHYGFTKTANLSVARGLAKVAAGTGVTVNSVLPGPTLTEGVAEFLKNQAEDPSRPIDDIASDFVMAQRASSIIQRAASVDEVANMVVYACSPLASATTGAALRVDGGIVESLG